jgi:hypothetical protein
MKAFEELQKKKVERAQTLLQKLVGARERLAAAEELKKHEIVENWLKVFNDALGDLKKMAETQRPLCPVDNQCHSLLQEEIDDLEKAIRHIEHVIRGAETLDQVMVSRVLIMVASRAHSLPNLLKAA